MAQSGLSMSRTSAARSGYLPVPLDQLLANSLAGIPVYLHTGIDASKNFALYCGQSRQFTAEHQARLLTAGVRFIYIPMEMQRTYRQQLEQELASVVDDPSMALSAKSSLVYETSVELINELLSDGELEGKLPRLETVARSISTLVVRETGAFSHLFATAQHDFYTATHMVNVGTWMTALAFALGITDTAELSRICSAGMVHDAGKMFIAEGLLNKQGRLGEDEWRKLREHPERGWNYLRKNGITDELLLRVTMEHHERINGSGYPQGLGGAQIHRASQICAVVDSFDAMTACRPFRNRVKTIAEAVCILHDEAGTHYDREVVDAWIGLLKKASGEGMIHEPIDEAQKQLGRRKYQRYGVDCVIKTYPLTRSNDGWVEGMLADGRAHNISQGGVGILIDRDLGLNTYVRVYVKGSGTLENRVIEGKVVRCRPYQPGCFEVGVKACIAGEQEEASARVSAA
jgi:HD-GYP domain-containing protein (c-di-GMP phosphodiesterase class II)